MKNLCETVCILTAYTTCPLRELAYTRHGWDGMGVCEMADKINLAVVEHSKNMNCTKGTA